MSKLFDRRDFLLHVAPLVAAPALILGSVSEMEAQIRNFALQTPTNNAQASVGQTVQISLGLLKVAYPKIRQINFKANGQMIGTTMTRPYQMNWEPTQAGSFTLTAEAVVANGTIVTTPTVNVAVGAPLEVLYDTLGNATTGWGFIGQLGYSSIFYTPPAQTYIIVTCYLGTLSSPKRLRGLELAVGAVRSLNGIRTELPPSYFFGRYYLGIWRTDVGTFYQNPFGGSLTRIVFGANNPNVGNTSIPVVPGGVGRSPIYVFGWDNLDVLLPANVPIQMAFYAEGIQSGDAFFIMGSSRPGPHMLGSNSNSVNEEFAQPVAARIKVSD